METQNCSNIWIIDRNDIFVEAKKQNYELNQDNFNNPIEEGNIALKLFSKYKTVIIKDPVFNILFEENQNEIVINIPRVSDGLSNIAFCFNENIEDVEFNIVDKNCSPLYKEIVKKEELLNSNIEYGSWISMKKSYNTILDLTDLEGDTPVIIKIKVINISSKQTANLLFERVYYNKNI